MSKNDEICIQNEELCSKNEKCCIKSGEFCIKNEEFVRAVNPEFNEMLQLPVLQLPVLASMPEEGRWELIVEVWGHDKASNDDFLGEVSMKSSIFRMKFSILGLLWTDFGLFCQVSVSLLDAFAGPDSVGWVDAVSTQAIFPAI